MSTRAAAAEVTRTRLIDAAIERFAADGLGASFDAVATDVGVTKGALYHHFGSKDGLVEAVYKEAIRRHADRAMEASASGDGRARLLALVDASTRLYTSPHRVLPRARLAARGRRRRPPRARRHRPAHAAQPARLHDRPGPHRPAGRLDPRRPRRRGRRPDRQRRADRLPDRAARARPPSSAAGPPSSVPSWRTSCDRLHHPARARRPPGPGQGLHQRGRAPGRGRDHRPRRRPRGLGTSSSACATARASAASTRRTCPRSTAASGSARSAWR